MINKFLINPDNTIEQALKLIQKNSRRCLVVVDKRKKLLGTLSDGDIRGALLENKKLKDKISSFYNRKAKFIFKNKIKKDKLQYLQKNFDIVPIIKKDKTIDDIVFPGKKNQRRSLNVPVVIMAGGKGTRMHPITKILPKPLIPLNEKPIISHIIDSFTDSGVKHFIISINYKSEIIKAYFNENKSL